MSQKLPDSDLFAPEESSESPKNLEGLGPRTAAFLINAYPKHRAKLIAKDFNVSTATAELWIGGKPPTIFHFEKMYLKFGQPFIKAVFQEATAAQDERLEELETSIFAAYYRGGIEAAAKGLEALKKEFMNWIGRRLKLQFVTLPDIAVPSASRMRLIEQLIETIPTPSIGAASISAEGQKD